MIYMHMEGKEKGHIHGDTLGKERREGACGGRGHADTEGGRARGHVDKEG